MTASITDFSQFTEMRGAAAQNDPAVLREVAGQFEALFLQTMLKSMRDASLGDPLLGNSDGYEMYQDMMDQQLSVEMSTGKGIGLADMLVRQLGGEDTFATRSVPTSMPIERMSRSTWATPEEFAKDIWPHAREAAVAIGVAPEAIVAQAALETGWGKYVMPGRDGASSFNLFGIKSGARWQGAAVVRDTLEFENDIPRQQQARFRAYDNIATAVADYTEFLTQNPRYENVQGFGNDTRGFAAALQESGYATDPQYAKKINDILDGPTMRRVLSSLKVGDDNG